MSMKTNNQLCCVVIKLNEKIASKINCYSKEKLKTLRYVLHNFIAIIKNKEKSYHMYALYECNIAMQSLLPLRAAWWTTVSPLSS